MRPARLPAALLPALLTLLASGCSPPGNKGGFSLNLLVDGALPSTLGSFQVELLSSGSHYDCQTIETGCLNTQVRQSNLVTLVDRSGHEHPALVFPAQVTDGGSQDVTVSALVGTDYKLVIEAISTDSPPLLLGTSCTALPDGIQTGTNAPVLTAPMKVYSPPISCNARWE